MDLKNEIRRAKSWQGGRLSGRVTHVIGMLIESMGPEVYVGEICDVYDRKGKAIACQVVGFKENKVLLMALGEMSHIISGAEVWPRDEDHLVPVGPGLVGRILDALGNPIDGRGDLHCETYFPVMAPPPPPLKRDRIVEPLVTGIKAIDALITMGRGQRIGIFSGSGVGKSTLMAMIAKMAYADVNVIALIGERGREVREFIERDLGPEGLSRSVVVVATADQSAPLRSKGANVATAIAEYFRETGKQVILMMDSITRYAFAEREIGLSVGEPPTHRGYPPSVFSRLPALLERAGNSDKGSITGIYTVLAESDDMNDPIADSVRSLLDGHIVLSRALAAAHQFPPIDVLSSLSRVMSSVVSLDHFGQAGKWRDLLQVYHEAEELINIGAYVAGSNPKIDLALSHIGKMREFLRQKSTESVSYEKTLELLGSLIP